VVPKGLATMTMAMTMTMTMRTRERVGLLVAKGGFFYFLNVCLNECQSLCSQWFICTESEQCTKDARRGHGEGTASSRRRVCAIVSLNLPRSYCSLCRGGRAPPPATSSVFSGSGHTLGSDDVPSSFVPDSNARGMCSVICGWGYI